MRQQTPRKSTWGKRAAGDAGGIVISSSAVWGQCTSRLCAQLDHFEDPLEAIQFCLSDVVICDHQE
jgi:hypothetical protein